MPTSKDMTHTVGQHFGQITSHISGFMRCTTGRKGVITFIVKVIAFIVKVITFIVKVLTPGMRWCLNINMLPVEASNTVWEVS